MRRTIASVVLTLFSLIILPFLFSPSRASAEVIGPPDVPPVAAPQSGPPAPPPPVTYTVQPGDTLSVIAGKIWGSASQQDWPWLWWANKTVVTNPNSIKAGWILTEPVDPPVPAWLQAAADKAMGTGTPPAAGSAPPAPAAGGSVSTSGMAAFEACVIRAESGGNPVAYNSSSGASGLFGFLKSTWNNFGGYSEARYAPVSVQEAAFAAEYAADGVAPWRPYDGC
ncbi:MAG TPA: transglycosylase family protein [Streptosporangiaceae bacterium]